MGEMADGLINGDFDYITGEYMGEGHGFPRTHQKQRKAEDLSWKKVVGFLGNMGVKQHLHPQILKDYGCKYTGKKPLRNACFEVLKDFDQFKSFVKNNLY